VEPHTRQPDSINSYSNLSLQASDIKDEGPTVPLRQRRPAAAEISPSALTDSITKRASGGATDSSQSSKRLNVMNALIVQSHPKSPVDLHFLSPPIMQPSRRPRPRSLVILEHHHARIARVKKDNSSREVPCTASVQRWNAFISIP
jgi:hypothetical protein